MEILRINDKELTQQTVPLVACIGYFDGFHMGHQELAKQAVQSAQKKQMKSALITFDPDPWVVLKGVANIPHITPLKKRFELIEEMGIDIIILLEFTRDFANLSVESFHDVLQKLDIQHLVCGFDFTYANMGKGNIDTLKKAGFDLSVIEKVEWNGHKVSSSFIEECIESGRMHEASIMMKRPFSIQGAVVHGRKLGRKIGFPTANLKVNDAYVPMKLGVYITLTKWQQKQFQSITSVGYNPTVSNLQQIQIETHILHFDGDLYDEELEVSFLSYIRPEYKFDTIESLIEQMEQDEIEANTYFIK